VAAAETGYASALLLVQALLKAEVRPASLWLVTRDAQPAGGRNPVQGAIQSGLWGIGKVIELEHPELNAVCIDLPQDGGCRAAGQLAACGAGCSISAA
jgi:hypothetical protein